jgi:crotonobetaine/carnitine-CoA ligase
MTDAFAARPDTFVARWDRSVANGADRPFLVFEDAGGAVHRWTYGAFDHLVRGVATWLGDRGVAPGSSVHLALTSSPAFVAVWLAAGRLGAWIVPSDPMAAAPELADALARTAPVVGICAGARADVYERAMADAGEGRPSTVHAVAEHDARFDWVPVPAAGARWPVVSPLDRSAVLFTSGTIGRPGVVITQANHAFAGDTMAAAAGLTAEDVELVVLPLFDANAQCYSLAAAISVGASVALMPTFTASGFVGQAVRHGATHAGLVAAQVRMILAQGGPPETPVALRLRHCWFERNLEADAYETLSSWLGCRPRQLYGTPETIAAVLTDSPGDPHPDTMGYVTPGCIVDLLDADGRSCAPGDVGEIVVGGVSGLTLFDGYLDDPAATASSFRGDWFVTGDRARRDADGRFRLDERRSDTPTHAGENVSTPDSHGEVR